jgi:uncharacterized protein (DUF2141 family)
MPARKLLPLLLLPCLLAADPAPSEPAATATTATATLVVELVDFRSDLGKANVTLFASKDGFPAEVKKSLRQAAKVPIRERKAQVVFDKLVPGTYAAAAHHDENGNERVDKNFLGAPKEPTGASNDAKGHMGPPSFDDAKLTLKAGTTTIVVHMHD